MPGFFEEFYARWLQELQRNLDELLHALEMDVGDEQLKVLVERFAMHYTSYYMAKSEAAMQNVLDVVASPVWKTPLETAFMWIGGWRPSLVFRLAYAQAGQEIEAEIAELMSGIDSPTMASISAEQLEAISNLQIRVQDHEDSLSQRLASLQQGIANQPLVGLVLQGGFGIDESNVDKVASAVESTVDSKLDLMKNLLFEADSLRSSALGGMLSIFTSSQGAQFLVVAAHLQFTYRDISMKKFNE